jgi:hypothetical protein
MFQVAGVLVRDPLDSRRTRSHHENPSHGLPTSEPAILMHFYMVQYFDPQTYSEVLVNPLWKVVMQDEHDSLLQNQTWDLVPLPSKTNICKCRWVHR